MATEAQRLARRRRRKAKAQRNNLAILNPSLVKPSVVPSSKILSLLARK